MAYVPKRLLLGRCRRCGKPVYKSDEAYYCPRCNIYICPICYAKVRGRCPICLSDLKTL